MPVFDVVWSTWRRYCDAIGFTMGEGVVGLISHELETVTSDAAGHAFAERWSGPGHRRGALHRTLISSPTCRRLILGLTVCREQEYGERRMRGRGDPAKGTP
jgi:hypothetical protein